MDLTKLVNLYVGREVKFGYGLNNQRLDYGLIECPNGDMQIDFWNITDKPQPTIAELEALQPQVETQETREKILAQIIELDSKRSRAFFEPAEKESGLTWLDYYNQEIADLRKLIV